MNKFNKTNSIKYNKFLFTHNPPAIIIKPEPEIKQEPEIKIEELKIEEIKIEEPIKPDVKIEDIKIQEPENNDMHIVFPDISEIYAENVEIIPEKNEIQLKKMKSLKLIVEEVILNLKSKKAKKMDGIIKNH